MTSAPASPSIAVTGFDPRARAAVSAKTKPLAGVWSATPTPLDPALRLDAPSVRRLVRHHQRLGVRGLFLSGNCGEGPFLPDADRRQLIRIAAEEAGGSLVIAAQVTDNSSIRILENIDRAREDGAELAVIAEPYFLRNATEENILSLFERVCDASSLPLALYNRGRNAAVPFTPAILNTLYRRKEIVAVKDSSSDPAAREIALAARLERPELTLLNGDEFLCRDYAEAGYDGALFGGAIFNTLYALEIFRALRENDSDRALALDRALAEVNWAVYGRDIEYWLSGLKYLMTRLGIFSHWANHLNYPLSSACRAAVDRLVAEDRIFTARTWA